MKLNQKLVLVSGNGHTKGYGRFSWQETTVEEVIDSVHEGLSRSDYFLDTWAKERGFNFRSNKSMFEAALKHEESERNMVIQYMFLDRNGLPEDRHHLNQLCEETRFGQGWREAAEWQKVRDHYFPEPLQEEDPE